MVLARGVGLGLADFDEEVEEGRTGGKYNTLSKSVLFSKKEEAKYNTWLKARCRELICFGFISGSFSFSRKWSGSVSTQFFNAFSSFCTR